MGNPKKRKKGKMGKGVLTEATVDVPEGVEVSVKSRVVSVKGPLGKISKNFNAIATLMRPSKGKFSISCWFKDRKRRAIVKSMAAMVDNMVVGVTKGYRYVMKYGHKRHPMKPCSEKDKKSIKIANYLGSQYTRHIFAPEGVTVECDPENQQKEVFVTGIDNEAV